MGKLSQKVRKNCRRPDLEHFDLHRGAFRAAALAKGLRECARRTDLLCPYGGEEFCLLLAGADEAWVREVDERLRAALLGHAATQAGFALGFSSGVAFLRDDDTDVQSLLRRADLALYEAKAAVVAGWSAPMHAPRAEPGLAESR